MTSPNLMTESPEQLFQAFLAAQGHPLDGQISYDTSTFQYFKCPHGGKTDARYKFYTDGIPAGYFKCWHCDIDADFSSKKQHEVTPIEWQIHTDRKAISKKQNELEIQQKQAEVALLANKIYVMADSIKASAHGYLALKKVNNYGLRVVIHPDENTGQMHCYEGTLLVPHYNAKGELVNLERIYWDKKAEKYQKRPLAGAQRSGVYYLIGEVIDPEGVILFAEGYSSAATIHEATAYPTAVTFSCGNMLNVVKIFRHKYPHAQLVIASDDDQWNSEPKLRHAGLKAAKKTCSNVKNTIYRLPDFSVLGLSVEQLNELKPTDQNDLFTQLMKKGVDRLTALNIIREQLTYQPTPHAEILNQLIKKIARVDFTKLANIQDGEKLKSHHFLIITVEQVLDLAKFNNWGICKNYEFIYVFNGAHWALVDADELKTFLGDAAERMGVNKFNARFYNFRDQLYKQFMALANLPKPEQTENAIRINLKNGTFKITPDGVKLNNFDSTDFMTYQLPFEYNSEATAPLFEAYLNKVLPDKNSQRILSEYLGYVFIRPSTLKLEKTLLLYGTGANGKSVFYEVVRSLLGDQNTSEYSLQSLTNENGYFRAMIANKLVNYASEINGKLEASIFKQLVSGEPVEARLPYGKPFTLTHYAKLIFNCNELPKDVEQTEAYFRRFLIIPFDVTIPEAQQDKQLAQKIIASELSGVFNWVLEGLTRLLEQKEFTACEAVKRAREQYERESDSVKLFLDEKDYRPHPTDYIAVSKLYPEYRAFCQEDGFQPVNKTNFNKRLKGSKVIMEKKTIGQVAYLAPLANEYKNYG